MNERAYVPLMSASAVRYITARLLERRNLSREYFIIEYGSGHSTKFFVDQLVKENIAAHYIAVERSPAWFHRMLALFHGGTLAKHLWTLRDYVAFVRAQPHNIWDVPEECRRLLREQKKMQSIRYVGYFLFRRRTFWFDATYNARFHCVDFEYRYIYEGFKDQFGESPHKHRYIALPLTTLFERLKGGQECHAVVMIDGGPRADIVKEIFSLIDKHHNLTVDIFLLEAYRGYYQHIISSRAGGRFIAAEKNEMLDGRTYLEEPRVLKSSPCGALLTAPTLRDALQKELWHFTNIS